MLISVERVNCYGTWTKAKLSKNKSKCMKMKIEKIYLIASFGDFDKLPLGGGQTSSRRLLHTLNNVGFMAYPIHRHPPTSSNKLIRPIQFFFWALIDPVLYLFRLFNKSRKNRIVICIGYMGHALVPLEFITSVITKCLRYTNVMYLKGGGTEKLYKKSNMFQQYLMRWTLNNYKLIMVEGYENIRFIKSISNTEVFYMPNYTENGFAPSECPNKPKDRWNLFYFGRINKTKNIPLCIDTFNLLCEKYDNVYLTIVGGGPNHYCALIEQKVSESPYRERINRIGRSSHEELKKMLIEQHFLLFPSNEPREGHSNALNEAMSFGLVPIVSSNNFLPSIVGDSLFVVDEFSADKYCAKIDNFISSGQYELLSEKMYKRVQDNFVQHVVEQRLKEVICKLK